MVSDDVTKYKRQCDPYGTGDDGTQRVCGCGRYVVCYRSYKNIGSKKLDLWSMGR